MADTYRFNIVRAPARKGRGRPTSEWLPGRVSLDEAEAEALALLNDPRDTITGVYLWSERWQQFATMWTRPLKEVSDDPELPARPV